MVQGLKRKMAAQVKKMEGTDVKIIMKLIKDLSCIFPHQQLQSDMVMATDPDQDVPSGLDIL